MVPDDESVCKLRGVRCEISTRHEPRTVLGHATNGYVVGVRATFITDVLLP
jgi:hypothetical protein